jgi:hypothetical protein
MIESISNETNISLFYSSANLIKEWNGVKGSSRIDWYQMICVNGDLERR